MTTPIDFSYEVFRRNLKAAIEGKRLAIQNLPEFMMYLSSSVTSQPGAAACMNTYPPGAFGDKSCHCVIGASYPPDFDVLPTIGVDALVMDRRIEVSDREREFYTELQSAHDLMVTNFINGDGPKTFQRQAEQFLNFLGNLPEKLPESPTEFRALMISMPIFFT